MLDDFKETQPIAYKTLINTVKKNRLSHAYIIETNNFYRKDEVVLAFAKYLLCPEHHITYEKDCKICMRISDGNYSELKIIEPDGQWIKKNQMMELQELFSKKAIEGNKKVYIIKEADKLNQASANSILKFLEEPEEGIVAILVVDNVNTLLSTIASRCQIISLVGFDNLFVNYYPNHSVEQLYLAKYFAKSETELKDLLENDYLSKTAEDTIKFIEKSNQNKGDSFIYAIELFKDVPKEKLSMIFDIMILFYKDVLNKTTKNNIEIFTQYADIIDKLILKNDTISISNQIKKIIDYKNMIKSNININLLVDKVINEGVKQWK